MRPGPRGAATGQRASHCCLPDARLPFCVVRHEARPHDRPKGTIVTRLAKPDVTIVNTHPTAKSDGDWSSSNRFYPVHRGQLARLARIVKALPIPAIVCGDFNVAGDSALFQDFLSDTGLADASDGRCPPLFHAAYLSPGRSQHCIDFILVPDSVTVEGSNALFTGKVPSPAARPKFPITFV